MPTPTYKALATVTLASTAASVTFSSIPATYRDLILISQVTVTTTNVMARLNGDTGTNYSRVQLTGDGVTAFTGAGVDNRLLICRDSAIGKLEIMDYSATDKHKTIIMRRDKGDDRTESLAVRWINTSRVNSILVYGETANIPIGSTFNLYGIVS